MRSRFLLLVAFGILTTPANADWRAWLAEAGERAAIAAQAITADTITIRNDVQTPAANAIVRVPPCTGTLIAANMVLTVGHCAPIGARIGTRPHPACTTLPQQAKLARHAQSAATEWVPVNGEVVHVGPQRGSPILRVPMAAAAVPHCADVALIRLAVPVPAEAATPLPVMTQPPLSTDRLLGGADLRHAGWGVPETLSVRITQRQTGPVEYWGASVCNIVGLPPVRENGRRIISGDSGSPLLLRQGDEDIVVAVLFGAGLPDAQTCGTVLPVPPPRHGTYTATWRPVVPGSRSTDLGAWLREMAPNADHR